MKRWMKKKRKRGKRERGGEEKREEERMVEILLRRRKYFPGFSGAGEISDKYIYINTYPAPEKFLNTLLRRG